jgi:hypothetical protein
MAISYKTLASSKTRYVVTLTSGTSWTVPTGCTNINATLQGGGGAGNVTYGSSGTGGNQNGMPGQMITTNFNTTPGASITYAIGAGGIAGVSGSSPVTPGNGGTTTMTGATSAVGGVASVETSATSTGGVYGTSQAGFNNGGGAVQSFGSSTTYSGVGGNGQIIIEYWA